MNAESGGYGGSVQAALAKGHNEIVWLLVEKGVDVNAQESMAVHYRQRRA